MRGRLIDFSMGFNRKQRVTIELDTDFREGYEALKEVDVEVSLKKWRRKRSLDANAYAWVLIDKIASATSVPKSEVYQQARMSDIQHFEHVSFVHSRIAVDLRFDKLSDRLDRGELWLGEQVLQDCRPFMPLRTGSLQQRSHTEDNGRKVVFPRPYGRFQYMGKVMVDSETGSGPRKIPTGPNEFVFRFRKGAKLVATKRNLIYSNPEAKPQWFRVAKARNLNYWISGYKREIGR